MVAVERSLRKRARTSLRRAVGWLLLGTLLASLIGVPIPQRKRLAGDAPFPCQDRPCGCGTAEACWQRCCCFSDSEKLVWAREHGVTPPEFVVQAALASTTPATATCATATCGEDAGCGDAKAARGSRPSCCSEKESRTTAAAPGKKVASQETSEAATAPEEGALEEGPAEALGASATVVVIDVYQRCRGLASVFEQLTEDWVAPAGPRVSVYASVLYLITAVDQWPLGRPQPPEPPVP